MLHILWISCKKHCKEKKLAQAEVERAIRKMDRTSQEIGADQQTQLAHLQAVPEVELRTTNCAFWAQAFYGTFWAMNHVDES